MYMLVLSQTIVKYLYTVYVYCGNKCSIKFLVVWVGVIDWFSPIVAVSTNNYIFIFAREQNALMDVWEGVALMLSAGRLHFFQMKNEEV